MENVPLFKVSMAPREVVLPRIADVLYSGFLAEGEEVYNFEREFADYISHSNIVALSSGTAALHLALLAAGVGPGDEVISTPVTAEPTNVTIKQVGATVVWADCNPANGLLDPGSVASRVTKRTKAIMAVDYAGMPAPLQELATIATEHGILLIEDAAQAFGAEYDGMPLGRHADFVVFSFQAIKRLTSADGGVLAFRNPAHLDRLRQLRWFGMDRTKPRSGQNIVEVGFKYTMNNVTAALARVQLTYVAQHLRKHQENARFFDVSLGSMSNIELVTPPLRSRSNDWLYTVLASDQRRRDALVSALGEAGIASGQVHRRNDEHSLFRDSRVTLPGVDGFYERMLHIPCGWWVTPSIRDRIVSVISEAVGN